MKAIYKFVSSIKLAVVLLLALANAAAENGKNPRQSGPGGAAKEPEQHRFGLIGCRVAGCDSGKAVLRTQFFEPAVAKAPSRLL